MNAQLLRNIFLISLTALLTGCVHNWSGSGNQTAMMNDDGLEMNGAMVATGQPLGGSIESHMDANDKIKLSRGLDGAPGRPSTWKNAATGATFTVTPIQKVSIQGAKYCRTYSVTMSKQGLHDRTSGTACIGQDGIWHVI